MVVALQADGAAASPLAVAATFVLFALFLSATAHVAARNVLGDVPVRRALAVGPLPAAIGFVFAAFELPSLLGVGLAVAVDGLVVGRVYGRGRRLTAYVTFVHVVVTIILGTVLVALLMLLSTAPG